MKEGLTEIICIVDMSGSMGMIENDAIGGFNAFINAQKELGGECKVSITMFDTVCELPIQGEDINNIKSLRDYGYRPRGMTALNDAIGKTINEVGIRLHNTPEEEKPSKVIVVIQTDGEENASTEFTVEQIKEMTQHQEWVYSWEFIYLGAGLKDDVIKVAKNYGISLENAVNYEANSRGITSMYKSLNTIVSNSRGFTSSDEANIAKNNNNIKIIGVDLAVDGCDITNMTFDSKNIIDLNSIKNKDEK